MSDSDSTFPQSEGIRINKYLASCGYESRRKADQLIADGAVEINGHRVDAPGARVLPGDFVKVNGKRALPKDEVSVLLNKPRGYVCSRDPQGAEGTVYDLLPTKYRHVNYVGRLDTDSEGLLILTNKGELNQRLAHPNNGIEKEYWVTLNQTYDNSVLLQLLKGVRIPEGQAKAKYIARLSPRRACVVLEQGLKRQVRQMFACLGFRVKKLVRVRIGSLWGGDLAPGRATLLTPEQEKSATINPRQRKGLIGAAQAFPSGGELSAEQIARALDEKAARKALQEETDYVFNPADFETEEEAEGKSFRAWDDGDFYPEPRRERHPRREDRDDDRAPRRFGRFERGDDDRAPRRFGRFERGDDDRAPRRFGRFERGDDDRAPRRFGKFDRRDDDRAPRRFGKFDRRDDDRAPRRFGKFERGDDDRAPRRFGKFDREGDDRAPRRFGKFDRRDDDRAQRRFGSAPHRGGRPGATGGKSAFSVRRTSARPSAPKRGKRY